MFGVAFENFTNFKKKDNHFHLWNRRDKNFFYTLSFLRYFNKWAKFICFNIKQFYNFCCFFVDDRNSKLYYYLRSY